MSVCHTPEQEALYARGYPHVATLVDGHKDDKKPSAGAVKVFKDYWGVYHVKWPRLVTSAFVRASAALDADDWDGPAAAKAATATGPVTAEEAKSIVFAHFARVVRADFNEISKTMFALEAIAGTDIVLGAIADGLEALEPKRWSNASGEDGNPALLAYTAGFLLLRSARAKDFSARLEAMFEAASKASPSGGEHTVGGGLDLALHGTRGAVRTLASSHWQYWYYYLMVDDAAVHIARLKNTAKSDWQPEARIVYLAGADMMPVYTTPKALRMGKRLPHFLRDVGMLTHDRVFDLMVDMIGVKGAADAPAEYFRSNAAYVTPKLERVARGSSATAVKAKAALSLLA
jgi:hypothetical protein